MPHNRSGRPSAAIRKERNQHQGKTGGHQKAYLPVQKRQVFSNQNDGEFPSGLQDAGYDNQKDSDTKKKAVKTKSQDSRTDAEKTVKESQ